jgi:hypothetical protein
LKKSKLLLSKEYTIKELENFTLKQLQGINKSIGQPYSGRVKDELIAEILFVQNEFYDDNVIR